jgi:hypothetical protein
MKNPINRFFCGSDVKKSFLIQLSHQLKILTSSLCSKELNQEQLILIERAQETIHQKVETLREDVDSIKRNIAASISKLH